MTFAVKHPLRTPSMALLSLACTLSAWGQTPMGAPNNPGSAGTNITTPATATGNFGAAQTPGTPQLTNPQTLPTGLARPILPEGNAALAAPLRPPLPALQKTEFQNFEKEIRKEIEYIHDDIQEIRVEFKNEIEKMVTKTEFNTKIKNLELNMTIKMGVIMATGIGILAMIIKM